MKIMHVINGTGVGGAETQLLYFLKWTGSAEVLNHVVNLQAPGPLSEAMRATGAGMHELGLSGGPLDLPRAVRSLASLRRTIQPDIVQAWMYHANLVSTLVSFLGDATPVVWGVRCSDMDLSRYSRATRMVFRACKALARFPKAIVANSQAGVAHHVQCGYPAAKMHLIPNGIDTVRFRPDKTAGEDFRAKLGISREKVVIGLLARFDPMKDHANFLQAAASLAPRNASLHFLLAGQGVDATENLFAAQAKGPLAGRCHFLGRVSDVQGFLNCIDVHVCSSAFGEGFSNSIGEAMAVGLPQVVTDVGDNGWLIGDAGFVAPPRDPDALARAILEAANLSAPQRAKTGLSARQRIEKEFSIGSMSEKYFHIYRNILT